MIKFELNNQKLFPFISTNNKTKQNKGVHLTIEYRSFGIKKATRNRDGRVSNIAEFHLIIFMIVTKDLTFIPFCT